MSDAPSPDRNAQIAALLLKHRGPLYGYIFSCLRNDADAEEVLQEVALTVTRSFEKLEDPAGFLPWAREIARRQVLVRIRQRSRTTVVSPEMAEILCEASARISRSDEPGRRKTYLIECLEKLSSGEREIITRRYDGTVRGTDELAALLGRTLAATYGVVKRVRFKLRQCVEWKVRLEANG